MEHITNLHWPAVALATVASFILGNVWFHPRVFGMTWANAAGVELVPTVSALVGTFLVTVLASIGIAFFMRAVTIVGVGPGFLVGVALTLVFVLPAIIGQWLFMGKPQLFAVNFGFNLVSLGVSGAIIGILQQS